MTTVRTGSDPVARRVRTLKRIGAALVAVPFALFSLFAIGEAVVVEPGWWSHLLQVAAVVALFVTAWRAPRVGGPLLIVVGGAFGTLLLLGIDDDLPSRLLTVATFFAPLVAAGVAFTRAGVLAARPTVAGRADHDAHPGPS